MIHGLSVHMQVEIEYVHSVIWRSKKPVMTIQPMIRASVSETGWRGNKIV